MVESKVIKLLNIYITNSRNETSFMILQLILSGEFSRLDKFFRKQRRKVTKTFFNSTKPTDLLIRLKNLRRLRSKYNCGYYTAVLRLKKLISVSIRIHKHRSTRRIRGIG